MVLTLLCQHSDGATLWAGCYSIAAKGGSLDVFIRQFLEDRPEPVALWFGQSDGFEDEAKLHQAEELLEGGEGARVVAALCTRLPKGVDLSRVALMPLDDTFFVQGVVPALRLSESPPWQTRLPQLFWCGRGCGHRPWHVARLATSPHAVLGFTDLVPAGSPLARSWAHAPEYQKYKYVAIIDGNVIASSLMWSFALGCVPVLLTHPRNRYWFQHHLVPYENYIPLRWDLQDYEGTIEWLRSHDAECERIAANARHLAETLFSAEGQRAYVEGELARALEGRPVPAINPCQDGYLSMQKCEAGGRPGQSELE